MPKAIRKVSFPLIIFLTSRIFIFSLALVFVGLWPTKTHPSFLEAFSQWDGQWYLRILKEGYWYKGATVQSPVAFFPLYPLLGKSLTFLGFSPELALFLVANFSCLGFFIFFWLLMKEEWGKKVAGKALFYYTLCPLSYVFSSLYTESLFLFLICSCFYFLKKNRFLLASFLAGLASVTRPFGIVLIFPILFSARKKREKLWRLLNYSWVGISGLTIFCLYLFLRIGDPFPFFGLNTKAWHHLWVFPWTSVKLFFESVHLLHSWHPFFPIAIFDLIIVLLFSFLLLSSLGKINFIYQIYMWPIYFSSLSHPWDPTFFLSSGSVARHLFQLFPLVGLLAKMGLKNKFIHYLVIFFFASLLGPFALAFFHGRWVE